MAGFGSTISQPHVAIIPSSGLGHFIPFLRFAALLLRNGCKLTLIITNPVVSTAESELISRFLSVFPQVTEKKFTPLPLNRSTVNSTDPFALQWETFRKSAHLFTPILSSLSPPLSFVISDVTLVSPLIPITQSLRLPNYVLFISSARMLTLLAYFSSVSESKSKTEDGSFLFGNVFDIPADIDPPIPSSSLPPPLLNSNTLFAKIFMEDGPNLMKLNGLLLNTFEELEKQSLEMLTCANIKGKPLPPIFSVGPLLPHEFEGKESFETLKWLDDQKEKSVVFVGFGSRTASSNDQIRELGKRLLLSGCKFLWVVKTKIVDKEDNEGFEEILGDDLFDKIKRSQNGLVVKWPQFGDQRINGEVIEKSEWVICMKSWGWVDNVLVKGEEIGEKIKELIGSQSLKMAAKRVSEEARKAVGAGGSCEVAMEKLLQSWKKKE
ncbi:UDP-glucuronosyl/UDP-glucosyltransferase [Corchorus olitorius]|uniref:UDP-glucuronosyl/UDP-glucosyltransferase n=1 Tax=Corchorus olitorius TaxID=93759 RepID=A0A1R3HNS7_9ROSI|nr:UDP-glucuronosyl/UDP-glucosyltransferase [Corchorus olitorius]